MPAADMATMSMSVATIMASDAEHRRTDRVGVGESHGRLLEVGQPDGPLALPAGAGDQVVVDRVGHGATRPLAIEGFSDVALE